MSFEFNSFNEYEDLNLFNDNNCYNFKFSDDWVEEALVSNKIFESIEKWNPIYPNEMSLNAVDENDESFIYDYKSYISKEAQSSAEISQMTNDTKTKRRIWTKVTFEELAQYVKSEIAREGYDTVLNFWLMKDEEKEKEKKVNMRNHNNKNKEQIQKLNQTLVQFPNKFPIKERRKLAQEIGLSEEQIYRWYYEHNPDIKRNKPKSTSKSASD